MRLTISQGAVAYARIVDPANRASSVVNQDYTDQVAFTRFRADARAEISDWRTVARRLRTIRWPVSVQAYITAMLFTYVPAVVRCLRAEAATSSYQGVIMTFNTSQDCLAIQSNPDAAQIRSRLGLPPLG